MHATQQADGRPEVNEWIENMIPNAPLMVALNDRARMTENTLLSLTSAITAVSIVGLPMRNFIIHV